MRRLWTRHPRLLAAFGLATALTLFFALRIVFSMIYWSDPAHRNQSVQGWMTVGYVARSWHLDPHQIDALSGLPPPDGKPLPLVEIARQQGVPVSALITRVEAAIATLKARAP